MVLLINFQVCTETVAVLTSIVLVLQRSIPPIHCGSGRCQFESVQVKKKKKKICMIEHLPQYTNIYYLLFC